MSETSQPVRPADHALMIDVQTEAAEMGLILITDGRDLAYTLPNHVPPGWTRFAFIDKNARRINPREITSEQRTPDRVAARCASAA